MVGVALNCSLLTTVEVILTIAICPMAGTQQEQASSELRHINSHSVRWGWQTESNKTLSFKANGLFPLKLATTLTTQHNTKQ